MNHEGWTNGYGKIEIFAAFRCSCGQLCAMADQENGDAAMVHTSPRCERFEALSDQASALVYFASLLALELTPSLLSEIALTTRAA